MRWNASIGLRVVPCLAMIVFGVGLLAIANGAAMFVVSAIVRRRLRIEPARVPPRTLAMPE